MRTSCTAARPNHALTYEWTYAAPAGVTCAFGSPKAPVSTITCDGEGAVTVTLTASDDRASASDTVTVTLGMASKVTLGNLPHYTLENTVNVCGWTIAGASQASVVSAYLTVTGGSPIYARRAPATEWARGVSFWGPSDSGGRDLAPRPRPDWRMLQTPATGEPMSSEKSLNRDIQAASFSVPSQPDQPTELQSLYTAAVEKCREAMNWYASHRKARKRWGRGLRIGAVAFVALAGLTPILVQLLALAGENQRFNLLASIFAVLGATCVGLDNYLGSSSGWMRYVSAYFELSARLEAMQLHWARQALTPQFSAQKEQLGALLDLLQSFIGDVNDIIRKETQEWMAEFKSNLMLLEQRVEAQRASLAITPTATKQGALKVQVENAAALKDGAWKVLVGTHRSLVGSGPHARVAMALQAGQYRIRLEAEKDGSPYAPEDVITIEPDLTSETSRPSRSMTSRTWMRSGSWRR